MSCYTFRGAKRTESVKIKMMTLIEKYINPFTDFGFKKFEAAEIARFSPEEKEQYEESLKSYRDLKNVIDTSFGEGKEEGIKEGKEEGIKEGREEGIKEGREEGIKEGKGEGIKQTALNMLKEGFNIDLISKITGLSGDEIGQLS